MAKRKKRKRDRRAPGPLDPDLFRRAPKHKPLRRNEWLDFSLELIELEGMESANPYRLCQYLERSRQTFYKNFADYDEFIKALMERWKILSTDRFLDPLRSSDDPPEDKLFNLLMALYAGNQPSLYEMTLRLESFRDKEVRDFVRMVDAERQEFVRDLFIQMGFSRQDADERTYLVMEFTLGQKLLVLDMSPTHTASEVQRRWKRLTKQEKSGGPGTASQ